jgi:hypothetical protein
MFIEAPPTLPALEPPPIPATQPTEIGGGAGVLIVIALAIEAIGIWRGRVGSDDYTADWIDWLTNPEREFIRRRSQKIAKHCCEIIAEEGARAVAKVPAKFKPNITVSSDTAKRYNRINKSRRN